MHLIQADVLDSCLSLRLFTLKPLTRYFLESNWNVKLAFAKVGLVLGILLDLGARGKVQRCERLVSRIDSRFSC